MKLGALGMFADEDLVAGDEESQRRARERLRREQRLAVAMRGRWPELARKDLEFGRHSIEHVPTGDLYRLVGGEVAEDSGNVAAFFVAASGEAQFLERPAGGPNTRQELEEQRAERERRRQLPRARPRR